MALQQDQILGALRSVKDPEIFKDIVLLNMVKQMQIDGTTVRLRLDTGNSNPQSRQVIERDAKAVLRQIGAEQVEIEFISGSAAAGAPAAAKVSALPQVKNIVAVGAGKGGVGKSTMALNLAIGLQRAGAQVGLMDGDIYGPSMPTLLGIKGLQPQLRGGKIVPFAVHGLHAITIGALVEQEKR